MTNCNDNRDAAWETEWDWDEWDAALTQLEAEAAEEDRYQQELEQQRNVTVDEVLAALAAQETGGRRDK